MTYEIICRGIALFHAPFELTLAQDPLPLEQNCDCIVIRKNELCLWHDDGTRLACFSPAIDTLYINSEQGYIDIWLPPEKPADNYPLSASGIHHIQVAVLQKHLSMLQTIFPLDQIVHYTDIPCLQGQ